MPAPIGETLDPARRVSWARLPEARWDSLEIGGVWGFQATASFWTVRQRQASPLHEVSYRACFKPQLPRFFIERLTRPGEVVYDPFSGRGTVGIEAALEGRSVILNDANPLGKILAYPRFFPPEMAALEKRLRSIDLSKTRQADRDLSMFYHPDTESQIVGLKVYLEQRRSAGLEDELDRWIRLVATNRLTGHSPGFFSVYTLPPNQAASPESQLKINARLGQTPEPRDVAGLILKKSRALTAGLSPQDKARLRAAAQGGRFLCEDARRTPMVPSESVRLVVTSPPFLDVVSYAQDNWLRFWFNGISAEETVARLSNYRSLVDWSATLAEVFRELYRVTRPGGWVVFEVGEVRAGRVQLEKTVVPLGVSAGFRFVGLLINRQRFTKTSNIWGVSNNVKGTNTNRIVIFEKKEERTP